MPRLRKIEQTVLTAAALALLVLLWHTAPLAASSQSSQLFQWNGAKSNDDEVEEETAEPAGEAVTSLADVRKAVVQIEAVGTFVDPDEGLQANAAGRGSGFIIDESGIAVTNNHVVTGGALFRVFVDGQEAPLNARVLGVSECADLAVIDIQGDGFPYLEWFEGPIRVGLDVYAVGFPLGDPEFTMTRGIVAKEKADGDTSWASVDNVLQHDADINPGNSGGPLVDANGTVVGINYRLNQAGQYFAISRDEALEIIDDLRHGQDVASLGINSEAVSVGEDLYGIWATSVESGSPADRAGIEPGDILLNIEGLDLATDGTMATYCEILRSHGPEDVLALTVLRFATDEVLEGQINGRPLEPSFSLADTLENESDGDDASLLEEGSAYTDYQSVSDEQGIISVEVPVEWADVQDVPWTNVDDEEIGIQLWVAPDVAEFSNSWSMPGMIFSFSDQFAATVTVENLLDEIDYSADCTYADRTELTPGFFRGSFDIWEACGEDDSTAMVLALSPETEDYLLRIAIFSVTEADLDAVDRILDTFIIAPPADVQEPPDAFIFDTVDDIDTTDRINDYLHLEDPALSALIPASWSDIESDDWLGDDDEILGRVLWAAPDLEAYGGFWSAPGLEVYMTEVDGESLDPYDLLDEDDYSDSCTYEDRIEHEHTIYGITYRGAYDIWRDCGEEGNSLLVLAALSDPADHLVIVYVQAIDDGDYEAFNILQRSFYVNTPGTADLIEAAQAVAVEQTSAEAAEFVTLTDENDTFSLDVPLSWSDVSNDDWLIDGDVVGRALSAAPDLVGFEERWDTPGLFLGVSELFAQEFTPDELLDALDFSDECTYDDRYGYDDDSLLGSYDIWINCGEVDSQSFVVLAANPNGADDAIMLLYVNLVTDADVAAFEQLLATLTIGDRGAATSPSSATEQSTVTVVTRALNVRSGPGTNFSRIDTVNANDELRVAGQRDNCAWLQILTDDGQPGWVSGSTRYVTLNGDCGAIPEVVDQAAGSDTANGAITTGQGCYTFQNQLGAELNVTITREDGNWNTNFLVPPKADYVQCFDPGDYTYTFDAPPPWNSVNGELTINAGDNFVYPISSE